MEPLDTSYQQYITATVMKFDIGEDIRLINSIIFIRHFIFINLQISINIKSINFQCVQKKKPFMVS